MTGQGSIANPSGESNDEIVVIGSNNTNVPVSFQMLQDIYNEITGKTEEIENTYKVNYKLTFSDLEQFYIKITQAFEQYNIVSHNCAVTVFFTRDSKEIFSSFERFKLFNVSTLSEIERIYLKFNFMIVLPKTKRVQNYEIDVNLSSRMAVSKKLNDEIVRSSKLFRYFIGSTAQVTIKYVDYLVARNFLEIIDEWIKCLPASKATRFYKLISDKSHLFPIVFKNCFFFFSIYLIWVKFSFFIPTGSTDLNLFAKFIIASFTLSYISLRFGLTIGRYIENEIDEYQPMSYISITRGDELLIEETKRKNEKRIIKAVAGIIFSIATGIASSIIANMITQ